MTQNLPLKPDLPRSGSSDRYQAGWEAVCRGEVGCLLVAGGQGTRLGFDHPKGCYPVTLIQKKSLFQVFSERIVAASKLAGILVPFAVMCSDTNKAEVQAFFESQALFGLEKSQLFIFEQGTLPFLDLSKTATDHMAPDGNGSALAKFVESGGLKRFPNLKYLTFCQVDNPLLDPVDPELVGWTEGIEVAIKCVERTDPHEKVGVLVDSEAGMAVVEYSEASEELSDLDRFPCANISAFCFSIEAVNRLATVSLPIHLASKPIPATQEQGYKQERFIFDLLPHCSNVLAVIYPREQTFAPLKGPDSVGRVKEGLQQLDRLLYQRAMGGVSPEEPFELSSEFLYLTNNKQYNINNSNNYISII